MDRLPEGAAATTLKDLGIEVVTQDGDELVALCPGHKTRTGRDDNNPSWSMNEESGIHYCFSCGYKGNIITLIRDIRGDDEARQFSNEFEIHKRVILGENDLNLSVEDPKVDGTRTARVRRPEWWLDEYSDPPKWARDERRVSAAACAQYGVKWDEDKESWVFPFRDPDTGHLLGYQIKAQEGRRFRNRPRQVPKAETFFGWHSFGSETKVVVLVESPLDAVLLSDMGVAALAICGSRISDEQIALLAGAGLEKVVIWMDFDKAGALEVKRLRENFLAFGVPAEFITAESYPEAGSGKDVGDLSDSTIIAVLDAAGV